MKIDKNVPIPDRISRQRNTKFSYLKKILETWEVGDSVAFKAAKKNYGKTQRILYSAAAAALIVKAKQAGQKTTQRANDESVEIRVWRVK